MVDGGGVLVSWLAAGAAVPAGRQGSGAAFSSLFSPLEICGLGAWL